MHPSSAGRQAPLSETSTSEALALLVPDKDRQEPERRFLARRLQELK
jgi:hypothetical protein